MEEQETVEMRSGEKIILGLLINLCKPGSGGEDADFIEKAVTGGHYWALREKYRGLYNVDVDNPNDVEEVREILTMWDQIEYGFSKLSLMEKELVITHTNRKLDEVKFLGFDGNNEYKHMNIAKFMIHNLGLFEKFSGRDLNSHIPMLKGYKDMLTEYRRFSGRHSVNLLSAEEIIKLLNEEV